MSNSNDSSVATLKQRLQVYVKSHGTLGACASIRTDIQGLLSCTTASFMLASQPSKLLPHAEPTPIFWFATDSNAALPGAYPVSLG